MSTAQTPRSAVSYCAEPFVLVHKFLATRLNHCYAERMAKRLHAMGASNYSQGFRVTLHPDMLDKPYRWKQARRIFVNSMSDLFHPDVPDTFIRDVFRVMVDTPWNTYQVLTKRPERLAHMAGVLPFSNNIWCGTSVESEEVLERVRWLQETPAAIRFLSCEPLLGALSNLPLDGIHWVIVGGESGPKSRPMDVAWAREIRDQCLQADVAFFFRQWGGVQRTHAGRLLDGRTWDEFPGRRKSKIAVQGPN